MSAGWIRITGPKLSLIGFQVTGTGANVGLERGDGTIWSDSSRTGNILPKPEMGGKTGTHCPAVGQLAVGLSSN